LPYPTIIAFNMKISDTVKIIACILATLAVVVLIIWIISMIAPILLGLVVFVPWLFSALSDGANI